MESWQQFEPCWLGGATREGASPRRFLSEPFALLVVPDFLHVRANSAKAVAVIVKTPAIIN
jgi:hypothetical protein